MLDVFDLAREIESFFADYVALVNVDGEPDRAKMAANYLKHGMRVVGPPLRSSDFRRSSRYGRKTRNVVCGMRDLTCCGAKLRRLKRAECGAARVVVDGLSHSRTQRALLPHA